MWVDVVYDTEYLYSDQTSLNNIKTQTFKYTNKDSEKWREKIWPTMFTNQYVQQ